MTEATYLVAGSRPWSRTVFEETLRGCPGQWHFVDAPEQLSLEALRELRPRYLFFLHWSWKVPREILDAYECVNMHMTAVPYGRGGSPLQNLIARGHRKTRLSALRMTDDLDGGPIYLQEDLDLEGPAQAIYLRAMRVAAALIQRIIHEQPTPVPQHGPVVLFARRTPEQSRLPSLPSLEVLHDFIRMLDADGYPRAFVESNGFRFEFSQASLRPDRVDAAVTITRAEPPAPGAAA